MTDTYPDLTRSLTTPPAPPSPMMRAKRLLVETPLIQVIILAVLIIVLVSLVPAFLERPIAAVSVLTLATLLALAAMGQTLVVIIGGLDLAIPGYITFGAMIAGNATSRLGWPVWLAFLVVIAVCGGIGALVGWFCNRFRTEPLVMTLGVGVALTGGAMFLADGDYSGQPPQELRALAQLSGTTFGIPIPPVVFIVLILGILLWLFLSKTPAGRKIYATGVNPRAAGLTRVRTPLIWTSVFGISGVFAGIAGIFLTAFGSGWSASIGDPYLFSGLAAVFVGGTTFGSIRGGFTRTALGALILTVLSTIIMSQGLNEAQTRIVYGAIILGMVAIYGRERRVRDRF